MFQSVVFDLDGTLLDTLLDLAAAGNHALTALGLPTHSADDFQRMVGHGMPNLVRSMLPEDSRDDETFRQAFTLFTDYYSHNMTRHTRPYPGIPELLEMLAREGVLLAVLSNKKDLFTTQIIDHYFPGLFSHVMGLSDKYPPKPQPDSLLALLQSMQARPESALYCGDSDVDVFTAQNAGIPCCGVLWGFHSEERLRAGGASYLAAVPQEVGRLVVPQAYPPIE